MKIYEEKSLNDFEFWAGAKNNAAMLTVEELDKVEAALEEFYPDGMSDWDINDIFWFDFGYICELIGLKYDEEEDKIIR